MCRLLLLLLLPACTYPTNHTPTAEIQVDSLVQPDTVEFITYDWETSGISLTPAELTYAEVRNQIAEKKTVLYDAWRAQTIDLDSVGRSFVDMHLQEMMPYWYGTTWAFEGHTDIPGEGEVACGYLVSTTIKHMGLNLNRYKLAQQASLNEAKTLAFNQEIIAMIATSLPDVISTIKSEFKEGLYLVGLDYHVGFILFRNEEVFFIHSSYYSPSEVVIELASESMAMFYNQDYYFAPISNNPGLMKAWLKGDRIPVYPVEY